MAGGAYGVGEAMGLGGPPRRLRGAPAPARPEQRLHLVERDVLDPGRGPTRVAVLVNDQRADPFGEVRMPDGVPGQYKLNLQALIESAACAEPHQFEGAQYCSR